MTTTAKTSKTFKTAEKKMLSMLEEIERLDKLSDDLMETDEEASDKAYSEMWELTKQVATLIEKCTLGQVDNKTAMHMALYKRDSLKNICKKCA